MDNTPKPTKVTVRATVRVTLEFEAGSWGGDCPLSQVYKQAKDDAVRRINNAFQHEARFGEIKLVDADVTAVIVPEK